MGFGRRPLPDDWFKGISRTRQQACMEVDCWRRGKVRKIKPPNEARTSSQASVTAVHRLVGLVVKASASRAADRGCDFCFFHRDCSGSSQTSGFKFVLQWLSCMASAVTGSALGLVGPVPVHCDRMRQKVSSASCISVWQHKTLSEQIRP